MTTRTYELDDPQAPEVRVGDRILVTQRRVVSIRWLTEPENVAADVAEGLAEKLLERGIETFQPAGGFDGGRSVWADWTEPGSNELFLHVELEVQAFTSGQPTMTSAGVHSAVVWALGLLVLALVGGWVVEQTTELVQASTELAEQGGAGPFDAFAALAIAAVLIFGFYLVAKLRS